ncbi:MAG: hypothetical protein Q6358_15620 [Candidatus Brocadiales bacterium]|nr:hypothetical protein [Candidatus Brocadiales bacterium]
MILKNPENRKKILDYLNNVNEDTFIDEVVIPFFGSQGFQVYRINSHGSGEHGKDIIFCRYVPIFFENEFIAVQAKAEQVTTSNVSKFSDQVKRALSTKFAPRSGKGDLYPHYVVFINARKHSNDAHTEFPQLVNSPHVKILSQENVCELIIQSGIAPLHILKQLSTSTPDARSQEDKLVFETILGNKPAEIDNLLDHKLKFLKDEISPKTKELIIDYIYDRWQMDRSWVGTVKPMKWFDYYFDFFKEKHSSYLIEIFEELLSSTPSIDAMSYTQSVVEKITPELLFPIEKEFIEFCAEKVIYRRSDKISYLINKLKEVYNANIIKDSKLKKIVQLIISIEDNTNLLVKDQKKAKDKIYRFLHPEDD